MIDFLIYCTPTNRQFVKHELSLLLNDTNEIFYLQETDQYYIFTLKCSLLQINYLIERSIFLKSVFFKDTKSIDELSDKFRKIKDITEKQYKIAINNDTEKCKINQNNRDNENNILINKNLDVYDIKNFLWQHENTIGSYYKRYEQFIINEKLSSSEKFEVYRQNKKKYKNFICYHFDDKEISHLPSYDEIKYEKINFQVEDFLYSKKFILFYNNRITTENYKKYTENLIFNENQYKIIIKALDELKILNEKIFDETATYKIEIKYSDKRIKFYKKDYLIEKYSYLIENQKVNLEKPDIIFQILSNFTNESVHTLYKNSKRKEMLKFDIKFRPLIGITCMNWELSLLMANICNVKENQIVLDPFTGCGGVLLACVYFNAEVIGIEKDIKTLIGLHKQKGNVKTNLEGKTIIDNFKFFDKQENLIGIFNADSFNFKFKIKVDAIICDPPYGERVSLSGKEGKHFIMNLENICKKYLKKDGKVCFWSTCRDEELIFRDYELITKLNQKIGKVFRKLFCFIKKK